MLLFIFSVNIFAQNTNVKIVPDLGEAASIDATPYDLTKIPAEILDIRRFEVVMFGVLPMAFFISGLVTDIAFYAKYKGDANYLPLFGSATLNNNEVGYTVGLSFAISFIAATADMIIVKQKAKDKLKKQVIAERRKISRTEPTTIDEYFEPQNSKDLQSDKKDVDTDLAKENKVAN